MREVTSEHVRLLVRVARMYHEQGTKQREIAESLHISQPRVSRLLKEAAERGIVRSIVTVPEGLHAPLEDALRDRFALTDAVVVDADPGNENEALGAAAAAYLDATLLGGEVLGVSSWSATLLAAVDRLRARTADRPEAVVQILGGVGNAEVQMQATRLIAHLAEACGAPAVYVPSAAFVADPRTAEAILADAGMRTVRDLWDRMSMTLVGIGSTEPSHLLAQSGNAVPATDLARVVQAGAVGDIALRYFDISGRTVPSDFDARVIGMDESQLIAVPRRLGVAGGQSKRSAIAGALRGGWLTVLITDAHTARALLDDLG